MRDYDNSSDLKKFFRNPFVVFVLVLDIIALAIIVGILIFNATKTATINFTVTPLDATISVNGNTSYENGTYRIHPGEYEVTISREGMASKTFTVTLDSGESATVTTFLVGEDDFGFYKEKNNWNSYQQLVAIASEGNNLTTDDDSSAEDFIKKFNTEYALLSKLPIMDQTESGYGLELGVNYQYDTLIINNGGDGCTETLCLYITDTLTGREDYALSIAEKLGFDTDFFEVIYKGGERE